MNESSIPACIGIILDGNRRWAKAHGLPKLEGHRRGYDRSLECARWVRDRGIPHLVVYAFSTENWNREAEEVSYLMDLLREAAEKGLRELGKENIRIRFVGTRDRLSPDLIQSMERVEKESAHNTFTLWICLSYGGRAEIVAAAQAASQEVITEESLSRHLWTAEMPEPDIIVRPGGEKRLSGFLTWKSVYSELFFLDSHWPDFSEQQLDSILTEYTKRERRNGK
jgi:undecaprenyl diphosphate synthase